MPVDWQKRLERLRLRTDPDGIARRWKSAVLTGRPVLYGVRHGTTKANIEDEFRGLEDYKLEEKGIAEAHDAAEWFLEHKVKPVLIVCSPLSRARRTAEIIGEALGAEVRVDEELKPLDVGKFTGEEKDKAWEHFIHYLDHPDEPIPDGESVNHFADRSIRAADRWLGYAGKHGPVILAFHTSNVVVLDCYLRTGEVGMDCRPEEKDIVAPGGIVAVDAARQIEPVFKDVKAEEEKDDPEKAEHEEYDRTPTKDAAWAAGGNPTLKELINYMRKEGYVFWFSSRERLRDALFGKCHEMAIWLAEMMGGTLMRGWYMGPITSDMNSKNKAGHHAHSWVEKGGKIYDPTWWAFTDARPGVYVFPAGDPRYVEDKDAEPRFEPKVPYKGYDVVAASRTRAKGYDFTNKGWLCPDGEFEGWDNTNVSHNEVAEDFLGLEHNDDIAVADDLAADEGYIAVSNDGRNVMFTFKRLDSGTRDLLRHAMANGRFPEHPLITLTNSGFGGKEIHKDFSSPEDAETWLANL